jgi:ribosomal-protein-alanine N-acetyltransferase
MKIDVFIKGNEIDLICLNEDVIAESNWYNWFNDEKLTKYMQKHYYPNTKSLQIQYYKQSIENNPAKVQCGIYSKTHNLLIGAISLNNIDFINRNCELSVIIGESDFQNINALVEAHKLMLRHAFDTMNLNRVYGGSVIPEINLLFCRALGYSSEGLLKQHIFKNGKYLDVFLFGISLEKFTELRSKWFKPL